MSAVSASPAAKGSPAVSGDPVRALQHALYRAAKADPGRRFHALFDKVFRRDILWRAWVMVRWNNGAPGIDKLTLAQCADRLGRNPKLPARRVYIPKPAPPPPASIGQQAANNRRSVAARAVKHYRGSHHP